MINVFREWENVWAINPVVNGHLGGARTCEEKQELVRPVPQMTQSVDPTVKIIITGSYCWVRRLYPAHVLLLPPTVAANGQGNVGEGQQLGECALLEIQDLFVSKGVLESSLEIATTSTPYSIPEFPSVDLGWGLQCFNQCWVVLRLLERVPHIKH